jgi:hypothetical protein
MPSSDPGVDELQQRLHLATAGSCRSGQRDQPEVYFSAENLVERVLVRID